MDRKKIARELLKVAKELEASQSILDEIVPQSSVRSIKKSSDEQTYKLAVRVYRELRKRLSMSSGEMEALNRLRYSVDSSNGNMVRNNVFKAADALGMKLPSSSF